MMHVIHAVRVIPTTMLITYPPVARQTHPIEIGVRQLRHPDTNPQHRTPRARAAMCCAADLGLLTLRCWTLPAGSSKSSQSLGCMVSARPVGHNPAVLYMQIDLAVRPARTIGAVEVRRAPAAVQKDR